VVSFPQMVRTTSGLGEARYALGDRLVDRYLEFVAGRARPNTLRAVAFDLKTFFAVIGKDPVEVTAADVFEFLADQRVTAASPSAWDFDPARECRHGSPSPESSSCSPWR
jgi:hypothetical protein